MVMAEHLRHNGDKLAERTDNATGRTRVSIQMKSPAEYEAGEPFDDIRVHYASDVSEKSSGGDLRQQPARSSVVQGYVKSGDWVLAAKNGTEPRKIMVKEGEPATLYLRQGTPAPEQLGRLGIVSSGQMFDDPLHEVAAQFVKLEQRQIPGQERRREKDREKAESRLGIQSAALGSAIDLVGLVRDAVNSGELARIKSARKDVKNFIVQHYWLDSNWLSRIFMSSRREVRISVGALGTDIAEAALALYQAATPATQYDVYEDKMRLLDLADSEFRYRLAQVQAEERVTQWKPLAPTACDKSARFRVEKINDDPQIVDIAEFCKNQFAHVISWNRHVANNIPVGELTSDRLFLEDAVGKSSSADELAGAHWAAHIYGVDETGPAAPAGHAGAGVVFPRVSPSKFNRMSDDWREAFFQSRNIAVGDSWSLAYFNQNLVDRTIQQGTGGIRVKVTEDWRMLYDLGDTSWVPNAGQTAYIDFLLRTADEVLDGLVLQDYAYKAMSRKFNDIGRVAPGTSPHDAVRSMFVTGPEIRPGQDNTYRLEGI